MPKITDRLSKRSKSSDSLTSSVHQLAKDMSEIESVGRVLRVPNELVVPDPNNPRSQKVFSLEELRELLRMDSENPLVRGEGGSRVFPAAEDLTWDDGTHLTSIEKDTFEQLVSLAKSILVDGLIQPISVLKVSGGERAIGGYLIEEGFRRYVANWLAGNNKIDVIPQIDSLEKSSGAMERLLRQVAENMQRDGFTDWEHIVFYRKLAGFYKERHNKEMTVREAAALLNISSAACGRISKVANSTNEALLSSIEKGEITIREAAEFLIDASEKDLKTFVEEKQNRGAGAPTKTVGLAPKPSPESKPKPAKLSKPMFAFKAQGLAQEDLVRLIKASMHESLSISLPLSTPESARALLKTFEHLDAVQTDKSVDELDPKELRGALKKLEKALRSK